MMAQGNNYLRALRMTKRQDHAESQVPLAGRWVLRSTVKAMGIHSKRIVTTYANSID